MKKPITIAVDCDGVLADLVGRLCSLLNAQAPEGAHVRRPEDFRAYNLFATLTPEEARAVHLWSRSSGLAASLPWYPGAQLFLGALRELGETFVATAPWHAPTWDSERRDWLSRHIPGSHVISVSTDAKAFAVASADVLIEDRPDTLAVWLHHNPAGLAILIDRPWNREPHPCPHPEKIHRVRSFAAALELVTARVTA